MSDWEAQLDARLRQVPLPPGLCARLQEIAATEPSLSEAELALLSDDAVDEQLCAVELPASLIGRLQADLATMAASEQIDQRLNDVAVPRSLLKDLRSIPWQLTHRRQVTRLGMAAAWFVMVAAGYYGLLGAWLTTFDHRTEREVAWVELPQEPLTIQSGLNPDLVIATLDGPQSTDDIVSVGDGSWPWNVEPAWPASYQAPAIDAPADFSISPAIDRGGPTREINAQFANADPWQDLLVLRWGVLGSPSDVNDRLPPLESLPRPRNTGVTPPLVRGFDREFLLREGVHPVVSPEANTALRRLEIPLTTRSDSLDLTWQRLREGRLPDTDELHIADFIAAMDYPLPPTKPGEVGLRTAAGPSPFGSGGARLLQISVQAGPLATAQRTPVHLTVAIDLSASMNLGGKLELVKRSLQHLLAHLGEHDRLSLLLFNDREQSEIIAAQRDDIPQLLTQIARLQATGGTNLAAGLQRGASLAMSETDVSNAQRKLVLMTDGRAPWPATTHRALTELLTTLHHEGLNWTVLDLSTGSEPDANLQQLASEAHGKLRHAQNSSDDEWLLTDLLVGHPAIVAPEAALRITFDPKAVAAYRLIGHEPALLAGLEPAQVTIDLRAGQVATGLLEVWLKPNSHDDVAVAELAWRDPSSGDPRTTQQRISRLQFVPTFAEAPLSLQAAAIAAQTGEVLKSSPFAQTRNRSLADVKALAYRVHPRLADRASYRRFVALIEAAERLRLDRIAPP